MGYIFVVDGESQIRSSLEQKLSAHGHEVELLESGEAALDAAHERQPDMVLLDLSTPGIGGMETLDRLGREAPWLPVVSVTAPPAIELALRSLQLGAIDYVTKPLDERRLFEAIEAALAVRRRRSTSPLPVMIGESRVFREVMDLALKLARPDINVLIRGESGTGKRLLAHRIHAASKRSEGPFISVDCSAIPERLSEHELFGYDGRGVFGSPSRIGLLERAHGGTLFLDAVGDLGPRAQGKLLLSLQERAIRRLGDREIRLDVRVLSATQVDLSNGSESDGLRRDLYFRLCEAPLVIPPLRDRVGDIPKLAQYFVDRYAACYGRRVRELSPEAIGNLESCSWPGNVRELESCIESAVVLAEDRILPEHLPIALQRAKGGGR